MKTIVANRGQLTITIFYIFLFFSTVSCIEPGLELAEMSQERLVLTYGADVKESLEAQWNYSPAYLQQFGINQTWYAGWDVMDEGVFGPMGYPECEGYDVRTFYRGAKQHSERKLSKSTFTANTIFTSELDYGYYDCVVWSDVPGFDGVQSCHIDEQNALDSIQMYTNPSGTKSRAPESAYGMSFYQPDVVYAGHNDEVHIGRDNPEFYQESSNSYVIRSYVAMRPITYIYLTQVIVHNNHGKIIGTSGDASITGMARTTIVDQCKAGYEPVAVKYNTRMKADIAWQGDEKVDIFAGRLQTFGICNIDPYAIESCLQIPAYQQRKAYNRTPVHHYLDLNLVFSNGCDSTLVFDVTDDVLLRFRGGVITVQVDADTIPMPRRAGGSGFSAMIEGEEDGGTYEIEM